MSAGNILVVDDDQNLIELIGLKLQSEGYEVTSASNGVDALQAARQNLFDLCVLDLRLHDQDGISLMRELHKAPPAILLARESSKRFATRASGSARAVMVESA